MRIHTIKKLSSGKYKVSFEDGKEVLTYDEVLLKDNLLYKEEIDESYFQELQKETLFYDLYQKMVKKISTRMRSTYEIERLLEKEEVSEKEKAQILEKLKEAHLLDDAIFAKAYVSDRMRLSSDGPRKIRKGLMEEHIQEEIIEEALQDIKEEEVFEKLKALIMKKVSLNHKYSSYFLKQKLTSEFQNLGYDREMIQSILDTVSFDNENIMQKEANRVYERLKKKYEGVELQKKLKEKLFQKGFCMSDISAFLEESGIESS